MVGLVLDHARGVFVCAQFQPIAMPVEGAHANLPQAGHAPANIRNAQAPFPVFDEIGSDRRDLRIDDCHRLRPLVLVVAGVELRHEQADALVHLRRGEPDTAVLDHRFDHVVDQLLHRRGLELASFQGPGDGSQHGMPHARHLQNGHNREIIPAPCKRARFEPGCAENRFMMRSKPDWKRLSSTRRTLRETIWRVFCIRYSGQFVFLEKLR